jgi:photosystem II oxygen-evolving enhancer protein 1
MRFRAIIAAFLALCLGLLTACSGPANAQSRDQLTYDDILGTGLANTCPQLEETRRGAIDISNGQTLTLTDLCLEPQQYFVKEESANKRKAPEFIAGKVLTRDTSTLEQITGSIDVGNDGVLTFKEKDGIDFQAITVQLPGGEQVPFMFTIKNLVATTKPGVTAIDASTDFQGEFKVPSYRGSVFLDPKGRSVASGYDTAVALPARGDDSKYNRANVKQFDIRKGKMSLNVTKVNSETGEIAGVFESEQTSATDLGAEEPEELKVRGIFYGRIESEA